MCYRAGLAVVYCCIPPKTERHLRQYCLGLGVPTYTGVYVVCVYHMQQVAS